MNNLVLRVWKKEDAQALAAIANNKNIWNNVLDNFPSPYTVMDALQWINRESTAKPITKFAIEYHNKLVGGIGLLKYEDIYRCSIELGYFVSEQYWGLGIATKAIENITKVIESENKEISRIFARVFEHNIASMKALQKAGFYLEGIQKNAAIKNNEYINLYVWVKLMQHH